MFRFFNTPRVSYSYSRPAFYRQRYIPIESYLLNSIKQAQEYERFKYILQRAMIEQRMQKEEEIHNENEQPKENINEEKIEKKEDQIYKENQTSQNIPFYYFESRSRFDGEKLVEERKERKVDSDGKVHQTLKRRLGDQWYQTEQIKDKEGKETVKEAWHNVSEEEIDSFKQEWIKHIGYQNKEIENDEKESPENVENDKKESPDNVEIEESQQNETENLINEQINEKKEKVENETGNDNENEEKNQKEQQTSNDVEEKSE